jgi:LysR family glycine cleavage system transcriptional activator
VDRLPLGGVRVFSVVARVLSVSRAAEELNVSPSAVSHQIRQLEQFLGIHLFDREHNRLRLTPAGEQYLAEVSEGLMLISRATKSIKQSREQLTVRVRAPLALASLWLVDRLGRFMQLNPQVSFALVATTSEVVASDKPVFDVAFSYGVNGFSGISAPSLGEDRVFPVCKPSLMKWKEGLHGPRDLTHHTLIDSTGDAPERFGNLRLPGWKDWLRQAGTGDLMIKRYLDVAPRTVMHHAVMCGYGIGLSRSLLAADALASRELVVPFGPALPQASAYRLVIPSTAAQRKEVAAFRDWILEEALDSTKAVQKSLDKVASERTRRRSTCPA